MDIEVEVGIRIKEERQKLRLTQDELAEKAGISQSHLGLIERGVKVPKITTLAYIAIALGVDIIDLFKEDSKTSVVKEYSPTIEKILITIHNMSETELNDILKIIKIFKKF